jgi:hypothetical protein
LTRKTNYIKRKNEIPSIKNNIKKLQNEMRNSYWQYIENVIFDIEINEPDQPSTSSFTRVYVFDEFMNTIPRDFFGFHCGMSTRTFICTQKTLF